MDQKRDFVHSFQQGEISKSELCRRYGITRKTGDKWIKRFVEQGVAGLEDLSRKPKDHPRRLSPDQEEKILRIRDENPAWGSKKIHRLLMNSYGESPARRTIDKVLKRTGRVSKQASTQATPWQRFEYEFPNELWQMDFKGHFALNNAQRCHPLTIIDDHSRYNLGLIACGNEQRDTVKNKLTRVFFQYGKPNKILADNGAPWGATGSQPEYGTRAYTVLEKWLMQHDIKLIHGRPLHPQTQGKDERFHRTLKVELLQYHTFNNLKHCQKSFDQWRLKYNYQRPHEALDFDFP